jgi:hypothetical protein
MCGHKEWAPDRKVDPIVLNMHAERLLVAQLITPEEGEESMLPINAQSGKEDIRLIQERLNTAFDAGLPVTGSWDTATQAAVSNRLGLVTGDPKGRSGEHVNGRMYSHLTDTLIRKIAGPAVGGLSEAQVRAIVNQSIIGTQVTLRP